MVEKAERVRTPHNMLGPITRGLNASFPMAGNLMSPLTNRMLHAFDMQDEAAYGMGEKVTDMAAKFLPPRFAAFLGAGTYAAANMFDGSPSAGMSALPMGSASRLVRAKEQGYFTDMPLYHGTAKDIKKFRKDVGGSVSGSPVGSLGISLATDPDTANEFAQMAAKKNPDGKSGGNVIQAFHRAEKPGVIELDGTETNQEVYLAVSEAWDAGYDAIMFKNYTTPGGDSGKSFILVKDPEQIRSVNAKFDPKKRDSDSLIAGISSLGLGSLVFLDDES